MGDHHHRAAKLADQPFQPQDAIEVEVVGRLVEQQQVGFGDQRAGERHALDATAREAGDQHVGRQTQAGQHLLHTLVQPPGVGRFHRVLQFVQAGKRRRGGRFGHRMHRRVVIHQQAGGIAQAVGDGGEHLALQDEVRLLRHVGHLEAVLPPHRAVVQRRLPGQRAQQAGLARAVAADQRHPFAGIELEVGMGQQIHMAEGQAGVLYGQQGHRFRRV